MGFKGRGGKPRIRRVCCRPVPALMEGVGWEKTSSRSEIVRRGGAGLEAKPKPQPLVLHLERVG